LGKVFIKGIFGRFGLRKTSLFLLNLGKADLLKLSSKKLD